MPWSMKKIKEMHDFMVYFDDQMECMEKLYPEDYYRYNYVFHSQVKEILGK